MTRKIQESGDKMGFYQMMELLQKKERGKIIICNIGNFYVAIGKDAVLLNNIIGLKVSCIKPEVCKVGFPINSLEKYTELLIQKRYSYIVYYFDQKKEELQIIESYHGKNKSELKKENKTYKHGGYSIFYVTEPKLRKIEKSRYIDRIVHRWIVDNILIPAFVPQFIKTSYACLKARGMHKACLDLKKAMKHCKVIWGDYYILKMDVAKFFQNIDKDILMNILLKKIRDKDIIWLLREIIYSNEGRKNLPIRELQLTDVC